MKQNQPVFNKGPATVLAFVLVVVAVVWAAFYFDGPPSMATPTCRSGEAAVLLKKWWCVQVREP